MPIPLIVWGAVAVGGAAAQYFMNKKADKKRSEGYHSEIEAENIVKRLEGTRDTMLQRSRAFLIDKNRTIEEKKQREPISSYQEVLSSLDIQMPPDLAKKLSAIPPFNFNYSHPSLDLFSGFSFQAPSKSTVYVVRGALKQGNTGQAMGAFGLGMAAKGQENLNAAEKFAREAKNFHEEVKRREKSIIGSIESDEKSLTSTVNDLICYIELLYSAATEVNNLGKPWDALTSEEQFTIKNYYYSLTKFDMLYGLPAFRTVEGKNI